MLNLCFISEFETQLCLIVEVYEIYSLCQKNLEHSMDALIEVQKKLFALLEHLNAIH